MNSNLSTYFGPSSRCVEIQNGTTALSSNYIQQTITKLRKGYYRFGASLVAWNDAVRTDSIHGVYLMCNGALTPVSTHSATGTVAKKFYIEGVVIDSSIVIGMKIEGTNATKVGQYVDDNATKRYFDTYASGGGILFSANQKITVPNGTYTVKALARTPNTGVFIYATGDKNYFTEVPLRTYDALISNETGLADSTGQVSDTYGPIWAAAATGSAIKLANTGKGRGWGQITVDDVVVNNHEITIGFSSDSIFTGKPFKGTWFSVVDFTLTLKTMGDNTNWVITNLKNIQGTKDVVKVEYFMLSGIRVATIVKGFNIMKTTYTDGTVKVTKIFQQ